MVNLIQIQRKIHPSNNKNYEELNAKNVSKTKNYKQDINSEKIYVYYIKLHFYSHWIHLLQFMVDYNIVNFQIHPSTENIYNCDHYPQTKLRYYQVYDSTL